MGTDVHGQVQCRWGKDARYEYIGPMEEGRNYRVFAMLADVRNGFGFAGVKTHEPLIPIAAARGLPDDIGTKDGAEQDPDSFDFGEHSQSYLYLPEIVNWDGWDKPLAMTGVISAEQYAEMKANGVTEPDGWSGGISGPSVVLVTSEQADARIPHSHVQIYWQVPFRKYAKAFDLWIQYLMASHGWRLERDPEAIRIVFGFDS